MLSVSEVELKSKAFPGGNLLSVVLFSNLFMLIQAKFRRFPFCSTNKLNIRGENI